MTQSAGTRPEAPPLSVAQEALWYVSLLETYATGEDAPWRRLRTCA